MQLHSHARQNQPWSNDFKAMQLNHKAAIAASGYRYSEALDLYKSALDLLDGDSYAKYAPTILTNMSSAYLELYDFDSALNVLDSAEQLLSAKVISTGSIMEILNLKKKRGDIYMKLGNCRRAAEIYSEVNSSSPYGSKDYIVACHDLAAANVAMGRHAEASMYALSALIASQTVSDSLAAYQMLARTAAHLQEDRTALALLASSEKIIDRENRKSGRFSFNGTKAYVYETIGLYEEASEAYSSAIEAGEQILSYDSPEMVSMIYGKAKSLLKAGYADSAMVSYSEYSGYKIQYMDKFASLLPEKALYPFWCDSNEGLSEAPMFCAEAGDLVTGEFLSEALDIVIYSKAFMSGSDKLHPGTGPDWKAAASRMSENAVAIEFTEFDGGRRYGAFVYRNRDNYPVFTEICSKSDLESITGVEQYLSEEEISRCYSDENLARLYSLIWEPISDLIGRADTVYFSPAGKLHLIPMEYLISDKDGKPFTRKHVSVKRMTSTMRISKEDSESRYDGADVFVNIDYFSAPETRGLNCFMPLRFSKEDEKNIVSILGKELDIRLFTQQKASERQFRMLQTGEDETRIMHISTHGYYFSEAAAAQYNYYKALKPEDLKYLPLLRSGLAMAGANRIWSNTGSDLSNDNDGILTAQEVAELDLEGYGLVVLAACQSGLGDLSADGIIGLQSAFRAAGAGKILVSLWPIQDQSATVFVKYFYKGLISGKSPEEALSDASEKMRKSREYSSPYHWAAYIIVS